MASALECVDRLHGIPSVSTRYKPVPFSFFLEAERLLSSFAAFSFCGRLFPGQKFYLGSESLPRLSSDQQSPPHLHVVPPRGDFSSQYPCFFSSRHPFPPRKRLACLFGDQPPQGLRAVKFFLPPPPLRCDKRIYLFFSKAMLLSQETRFRGLPLTEYPSPPHPGGIFPRG